MFSASRAYVPTPNQRLILELIRTRGPISRADIVRLSSLTFPSVSRIVGELIDRDLVEEKRQRRGGMGKPPTELELNPESAFSVGLSLDYDELSAALIDLSGAVLVSSRVAVDDLGPDVMVPLMECHVGALLEQHEVPQHLLLGIGVGLPLPVHNDQVTGNLPELLTAWQDVSLASVLGKRFGYPVLLENNATAAAIGERWYGAGRDLGDFFLVFFAHGMGGGVVVGGRPHRGYRGFGGEFSCVPSLAPGNGSGRGAGEDVPHDAAHGRLMGLLKEAGVVEAVGDASGAADLEALYSTQGEGYEVISRWLGEAADALVPTLVNTEYLLDPEAFIFGGRLPEKLTDALIEELRVRLDRHRHPAKPYQPQLLRGKTGGDAAAFGAATIPIYRAMTPDPTPDASYRAALAQELIH